MDDKSSLQVDEQNQVMNLRDRLLAVKDRAIALNLTREHGWKSAMARAAGCTSQNITNATRDVAPQEDMGAELLRRIAVWARVNEQWMLFSSGPMLPIHDAKQGPFDEHAASRLSVGEPVIGYLADVKSATLTATRSSHAPRISKVGRKGEVLYRANNDWPDSELRPFFTKKEHSAYCKFVLVNDDDMAPALRRGDWVLIDPNAPPERGKTCLFLLPDDSYVLRQYEVIAGGGYEARDTAGRTLSRERHGIEYAGRYVLMQREDE